MGCIACAALVLDGRRHDPDAQGVEHDPGGGGLASARTASSASGRRRSRRCRCYYGRRQVTLGDLFEVEGAGADNVTVRGDLKAVKKIGHGMSMGRITRDRRRGAAPRRLHVRRRDRRGGRRRRLGGRSHVGRPHRRPRATPGHFAGAAYSGEPRGMRGGTIVIRGNVRARGRRPHASRPHRGARRHRRVRRRRHARRLRVRARPPRRASGRRHEARHHRRLRRGAGPMLPTFRYACSYRPVFLQFYLRSLTELGHHRGARGSPAGSSGATWAT